MRYNAETTSWWLFLGSAVFFLASSVRNPDPLGIVASTFFTLGCLVFLFGKGHKK
ncbi:MAG TPA: hypothetical protein QF762_05210 [Acidimicrobiales bacterium]|nr:hypothetical protein [Acidimicrobiales bacterium]